MSESTSSVELGWTLVAIVGALLSGWAISDDADTMQQIWLAVSLKRALAWGPRWWMALAFLVSDGLFLVVWLGFAALGINAAATPAPVTQERIEAANTAGWLLIGLEAILATIQLWWRVVRIKLRGFGAWVHPAPSYDQQLMRRAAIEGRPLIHDLLGELQVVVSQLDVLGEQTTLQPAQEQELDAIVVRLQHFGVGLSSLQRIVRGLGPLDMLLPETGLTPQVPTRQPEEQGRDADD